MNANAARLIPRRAHGWLMGFANMLAKENAAWWRTGRWWNQALVAIFFVVGSTVANHQLGGAEIERIASFNTLWVFAAVKLLDLEMHGTASKSKHELIKQLGATPIDYKSEDFVKRIHSLTVDGVDAVFDPIGGDNFKRSFSVLRQGGKLVAYGFYNATLGRGGSIPLDFIKLMLWNLLPNKRSTAFYSIVPFRKKHADWFLEDLTALFDLLAQKKIKPVIAARMPLTEAKRAHDLVEQAEVQGKIVLTVSETPA